ncbi:DUF6994 family protein [uncultured Amnibacterium sp.]|uniref:DUF6994 family protein n=1 Tax=uncultured Amnibacterium sp. TaxID=1631851 RepID=UPI0035CA4B93
MSDAVIDLTIDFRAESAGRDPDSYSPTLQRYHQLLWSKPLPSGAEFDLTAVKVGGARVLRHESALGVFVLSSDTLTNSNKNKLRPFYDRMRADVNAAWHRDAGSIGGRLVFPRNKIEGRQTVNQERGTNHRIRDRFDLTLEAIRRHYVGQQSPLTAALQRYADFFTLFGDFSGYVRFFLLDDLVHEGAVRFYLPFAGYDGSPLPQTFEAYQVFRAAQLAFVAARNSRIAAEIR